MAQTTKKNAPASTPATNDAVDVQIAQGVIASRRGNALHIRIADVTATVQETEKSLMSAQTGFVAKDVLGKLGLDGTYWMSLGLGRSKAKIAKTQGDKA